MNELLKIILSLSLSGTILILSLFLLRPIYQSRLSKRWQYYIWLLVILRLLLPFTPETSVVGNLFGQIEQRIEQDTATSPVTATVDMESPAPLRTGHDTTVDGTPNTITSDAVPDAGTDNDAPAAKTPPAGNRAVQLPGNLPSTLGILWLVIALLLFVRKITIYQSFVKYVKAGGAPVEDMDLLERFGRILAKNHVHAAIDLRANSLVSSPLLMGFFHACIVLPTTELSDDDFYYTALHELTHYKRKDMFYKWLVQLTICLHWFNPFVYLMGREINRLCELSCDERVISTFTEKSRKSYGDTLLHAISEGGSYKDALASITLHESKELLKGRLDAIMKYQKIPKLIQTAGIFLTGILIGGAVVLGAYAAPKKDGTDSAGASVHNPINYDSLPDYTIQYEDGTYYIMVDDATEFDKPISNVTEGYKHLVLVRKGYYATFGTFDDHDMTSLARHIKEQCRTRLNNNELTQENADIVMHAAEKIQAYYCSLEESGTSLYRYTQSGYCQYPYLIWIGYNLSSDAQTGYDSTLLTLPDQSTMRIWFNQDAEAYLSDPDALSAVAALAGRIQTKKADSSIPFEAPIITQIEYIGDTDLNTLAQDYYSEDNLTYFIAVFPELDSQTQQDYLDRMYEDDNISFFAACIDIPEDAQLRKELTDRYMLKAYEEDNISFFSVLSSIMLDDTSRTKWKERCRKDGKSNFYAMLNDYETPIDEEFSNETILNEDFVDTDFTDWNFPDKNFTDDGFLDEWFQNPTNKQQDTTNIIDLNRLLKKEIPNDLQTFLDTCDNRKWYLIDDGNGLQYIYYNGLPHTYTYEPNLIQKGEKNLISIDIFNAELLNSPRDRDTDESLDNYVLLAFSYVSDKSENGYSLEITYNGYPVTYEIVQCR